METIIESFGGVTMSAFEILSDRIGLLFIFVIVFIVSYLAAEIFYWNRKDQAIAWVEKLDKARKPLIRIIYNNMHKRYGMLRAAAIIFLMNIVGGSFLWSTSGGIFIVFPFLHYIIIAFLVNLALKIYPERRHWLVIPNTIFEVAAFMVAALGSIHIGLSILSRGDMSLAIYQWAVLFMILVIPLQIIAAVFEGLLLYRIHIVSKHPWPYGISE